jgi:dienelactone hydrolase
MPMVENHSMPFETKSIEYRVGDATFEGVLTGDLSRSAQPGLVMFANALGVSAAALETAQEIAARGYVVFLADLYGKSNRPTTLSEGSGFAGPLRADRKLWRQRANASVDVLREQSSVDAKRIGALGFCFGGSTALELARSGAEVRGVASLHGGLASATPEEAKAIRGSVFVLHGADDPFVPPADVRAFEEEMRAAKVDWQLIEFGGAVHSFSDKGANIPGKAVYDEKVARRALAMVDGFFKEVCA